MAGREVATKSVQEIPGLVSLSDADLEIIDGLEGSAVSDDIEDRGTPLLYVAQKQSKYVNERKPEYVPGLKAGMLFNNLTGQYWDVESGSPLVVLPCFFRKNWMEWTPQSAGGGFHGMHSFDDPITREAAPREGRRDILDMRNGHELVLTHHYYCLVEETMQPIVVPMSSTQLGASTKIQNLLNEQRGRGADGVIRRLPGFFSRIGLRTVYTTNDSGDWFKMVPSYMGRCDNPTLLALAREFAMAVRDSQIKIAEPDRESGQSAGVVEDSIPF